MGPGQDQAVGASVLRINARKQGRGGSSARNRSAQDQVSESGTAHAHHRLFDDANGRFKLGPLGVVHRLAHCGNVSGELNKVPRRLVELKNEQGVCECRALVLVDGVIVLARLQ